VNQAGPPWRDDWFAGSVKPSTGLLWRGVEAQHRVATMRLVDSLAEQAELERMLEASKPPLPAAAQGRHYLIATPFRYRSPHASRFRGAADPGVWYGAKDKHTACVEVGYWRWRFLMDSAGLRDGELITEHTFFQAQVRGRAIDLTRPPWSAAATQWAHRSDYRACQALGRAARSQAGVQWLRYASVRHPGGICAAVFAPDCLTLPDPSRLETWVCKVTAAQALMLHDEDRLTVAIEA
jgi:hypothetical protein